MSVGVLEVEESLVFWDFGWEELFLRGEGFGEVGGFVLVVGAAYVCPAFGVGDLLAFVGLGRGMFFTGHIVGLG